MRSDGDTRARCMVSADLTAKLHLTDTRPPPSGHRNVTASTPTFPATAITFSGAMTTSPTCTVTGSTIADGSSGASPNGRRTTAGPKPVPYAVTSSPDLAGASPVT